MNHRRHLLLTLAALPAVSTVLAPKRAHGASKYASQLTDDGLYTQPWFMQSFLEMASDLGEAHSEGKRFVVLWEQKGCPYCKEMHTVNLAHPEVNEYLRRNFSVVQLNLWGAREVTDFDGKALEERALARRWRVNFTPTIQFFPPSLEGHEGKPGVDIEVARMPGYFKPFHFLSMFEYVKAKAYATSNFQRYLQKKFETLKAKGVDADVW